MAEIQTAEFISCSMPCYSQCSALQEFSNHNFAKCMGGPSRHSYTISRLQQPRSRGCNYKSNRIKLAYTISESNISFLDLFHFRDTGRFQRSSTRVHVHESDIQRLCNCDEV